MNCQKSLDLAYKIRLHALEMTSRGGTSHIASIFSMADLVAVLYADVLRYDPHNPRMPGRDRLLLSKGHAGAGIYAALAESGFFPVEELLTHCQNGSRLSGHVSHKGVPGVEASTGSLGQGMPMAWAWRWPQSSITKRTACTASSATANATRAPFGKARSSLTSTGWITSS